MTATAAPPADAPAGSTGLCNDGSYYSGAQKKGACKGHRGLKEWFGATSTGAASSSATGSASANGSTKPRATKPTTTVAPGGSPGMVWANESTKIYHCPGDRWYGKTKQGEYLTETDAKAKGFKPSHGKACE